MRRNSRRPDATLPQAGLLSDVATDDVGQMFCPDCNGVVPQPHQRIEYALQRARSVERKHPLLSLIYRVVAEVLHHDRKAEDDG